MKITGNKTTTSVHFVHVNQLAFFTHHFAHNFYGLDYKGDVEDLKSFDETPFVNHAEMIRYTENILNIIEIIVIKHVEQVKKIIGPALIKPWYVSRFSGNNHDLNNWLATIRLFYIHMLANDGCIYHFFENNEAKKELETLINCIAELENIADCNYEFFFSE